MVEVEVMMVAKKMSYGPRWAIAALAIAAMSSLLVASLASAAVPTKGLTCLAACEGYGGERGMAPRSPGSGPGSAQARARAQGSIHTRRPRPAF